MNAPDTPGLGTGLRMVWDERSRDYPVRDILTGITRVNKNWPCNLWLDQLQEGACVGFACAHEAGAEPVAVPGMTDAIARDIYKRAQRIDEWPGENYDGTSVLAGAKIMVESKYWLEYRWAFGIDDVIDTLVEKGPVVFGTPWYQSMFQPQADGRMIISGVASGAHAYLGNNLDWNGGKLWIHNSWMKKPDGSGSFWGINGNAWMPLEDFDKLLKQGGQAMVPVKRNDPSAPPPTPPPTPGETTLRGASDAEFDAEYNRRYGYFKDINIDIGFTGSQRRWTGHFDA